MKMEVTKRGIVIPYSLWESLGDLSYEKRGTLCIAMMEYGQNGTEPDFGEDTELRDAWKRVCA